MPYSQAGCKGSAIPDLTTPDLALSTPTHQPRPGEPYPPGAGRVPPSVPVVPHATYMLNGGDRGRKIVFGQQNLSNVSTVSATGTVSVPLIG